MTADVSGDVTAQLFEGDLEVSQRFRLVGKAPD